MSKALDLLIVPFRNDYAIILPKKIVEYVLPYAPPLPADYTQPALVGSLIYKNEKIPVMDMAILYDSKLEGDSQLDGKHRIVIVSCTSNDSLLYSYAIISSDLPRAVGVTAEEMTEVKEDEVPPYFYSQVYLRQAGKTEKLLIPDIVRIEKEILCDLK